MRNRSKPSDSNSRGFTLVEVLVVMGIIAVLAALIFPVYAHVKAKGKQTACLSNLRQLWSATVMYAQDYDGYLPIYVNRLPHPGESLDPDELVTRNEGIPAPDRLYASLRPFVKESPVRFCPTDPYAGQDVTRWGVCHMYFSYEFLFQRRLTLRDTERFDRDGTVHDASHVLLISDVNELWSMRHELGHLIEVEPGCEHDGGLNRIYLDGHTAFWQHKRT
ncbi:MAG TPA: prepilin-type N-terminal cleavage/methylation domain-containing protein [Armatimonadota bacterium]|nr:prepilin-type N-terminal cleavage/methylation domain-containing protein [Armatimonadota bacterium]